MKRFLRTPFASALGGGLVVALLGWAAIAAGWVEAGDNEPAVVAAPVPLTEPAAGEGARALTVNEIYNRDADGVAFIKAERPAEADPLSPFGAPQRGLATGSGFVIDHEGHVLTN